MSPISSLLEQVLLCTMTHLLLPNTMSATTLVFVCALVLKAAPIGLKDLKVSVPMSCVDVDTDGLVDRRLLYALCIFLKNYVEHIVINQKSM